MYAAERNN